MASTLCTIPFNPPPRTDGGNPWWTRECRQGEIRGYLNGGIGKASNGTQTHMRYAPRCYASYIVIEAGCKLVGWPPNIPFTDLANIDGGSAPLAELHRRCHLPDGHPDKLRFEPASPEDRLNAARDPETVHPTPHLLPVLKAKAAEADARVAARVAAAARARSYHPRNMQYVGRPPTAMSNVPRSQRRDAGKRRPRASDNDPRVLKKRQKRGVRSMPFVLPGSDGTSRGGDGEPAAKRQRVGEYALHDAITQFALSPEFDGELTDSDPIESASGYGSGDEED